MDTARINAELAANPKPTSARPREVGGFTWRCYTVAICKTEWRTDGALLAVGDNYGRSVTYWSSLGGKIIGRRHRSLTSAMEAVAKASGFKA